MIKFIYHGSKNIIEKPYFHGGRKENDYGYGFYCTESNDLAKEWAASNNESNGFSNKYSIDIEGLRVLNLTSKRYSILNWMAILLNNRTFGLVSDISKEAREYLINNFYVDVEEYDIVIGYRADDSYFSFARDFVNNTISLRQLSRAMELGELGKQFVIVSKKAFDRLVYEGYEVSDRLVYYPKRMARDTNARKEYLENTRNAKMKSNDLFVIDIIRRGLKDGDTFL